MNNFHLLCYYVLGLGITDERILRNLFMAFSPNVRNHVLMTIVERNGQDLGKIPANLRTREICLAAIKQNGHAIEYVPNSPPYNILDYQMCIIAIEYNGIVFQCIPDKFRTYDLRMKAVKQNSYALRLMHLELNDLRPYKQYALCLEAVKKSNYMLKWVPKKFRDRIIAELNIKDSSGD